MPTLLPVAQEQLTKHFSLSAVMRDSDVNSSVENRDEVMNGFHYDRLFLAVISELMLLFDLDNVSDKKHVVGTVVLSMHGSFPFRKFRHYFGPSKALAFSKFLDF